MSDQDAITTNTKATVSETPMDIDTKLTIGTAATIKPITIAAPITPATATIVTVSTTIATATSTTTTALADTTASPSSPVAVRAQITDTELDQFTKSVASDEFATKWRQQDIYITMLEQRFAHQEGEMSTLRDSEERCRTLYAESQQREKVLVRRLAAKEQEMQDYVCQLADLKVSQSPTNQSLRSTLLDPSVNVLLQLLRQEVTTTRTRLEETQNELSAWKFTPDSNTGKRLMAKCRQLYQENEELGKMTSSGRLAKLESELALQKSFSDEVKKSQTELDEFVQDLDEDVEGMQSTIYYLQQELRKSNETVAALQAENGQLRSIKVNGTATAPPVLKQTQSDSCVCNSDSEPELIIKVSEQEICAAAADDDDDDDDDEALHPTITESNKRTYDSDSSNQQSQQNDQQQRTSTPTTKKVRRSSVLSLDYNDDDALVISTNGDVASDAE